MATFVLVHGTSCGGWIWKKIVPLLHREGHEVYAPTLTGLGDRSHLLNCGVDLTTHIRDITGLLEYEDLTDVILVGNSYGGMVITGVAAKIPSRLKLLVYLDAYLPDIGQSEADLLPAEMFSARQADAMAHGGAIKPPPLSIFGVFDPDLEKWTTARMTPHPLATYTEPVRGIEMSTESIRRIFIRCTGNPVTTPDLIKPSALKAAVRGWQVVEINAGHLAMLTAPSLLAETLLNQLD